MKFIIICLFFSIALSKPLNSKRNFQFTFPGGERKSRAILLGTIDHELKDFTVCHWSKTNREVSGPVWESLFNYITQDEKGFTIATVAQHKKLVDVYGDGKLFRSEINLPSNEWMHLCFVWSVTDCTSETYINGQLVSQRTSPIAASPIKSNGIVQLGAHAGDRSRLRGQISEVNLWDYALSLNEVEQIYNCESQLEGNIISWYNSVWELFEGTTISHVYLPCGGRK